MSYTLEEIKKDIKELEVNDIYQKYIESSYCWYFENVLSPSYYEYFIKIICDNMHVSPQNITVVGSAKIGYSLAPQKELRAFNYEKSDIDVVIVSDKLFKKFWWLYRKSFKFRFKRIYEDHIYAEIYRGFINERNVEEIDGCKKDWRNLTATTKNLLHNSLFIKQDIKFRIYRSWDDFEEYNKQSIKNLKRELENVI